jgi:endonuclease/exonuclease/phosphatase family metal-dependent hydrolase
MPIRIGTSNTENLFLRYRLLGQEPKPFKKTPEPIDLELMAKDFSTVADLLKDVDPSIFNDKEKFNSFLKELPNEKWRTLMQFMKGGSFITQFKGTIEDLEPLSHTQRKATAQVIIENKPDFVGVEEIESLSALDQFYYKFISKYHKLPYHMLIEGNDPRGIDVGLLNGQAFPVVNVRSHRYDRDPDNAKYRVFSRDCLEVDLLLPNHEFLTIYVNHFKSQLGNDKGVPKRTQQAKKIKEILEKRFGQDLNLNGGRFIVLGDLNCEPVAPELDPLLKDLKLFNVFENLEEPERWSHIYVTYDKDHKKIKSASVSQLDYILLSPTLKKENPNVKPKIERQGLVLYDEILTKLKEKNEGIADVYYNNGKRFQNVEKYGTEASDHCGVFVDLEI